MPKNIIIGTAGHIDHGKSTLIKALTGDETDRLTEEKERGISIEPGFSHLETEKTAAENLNLGIVDVPGHEKFVNKMLSAAAGVDLALIVVAADEGVMPQTKEHVAILDLLAVEKAIVVVTKIDLVDREWIELIEEDLRDNFENTFVENAEIIRVSAVNKQGIKELKELIVETALKMKKRKKAEIPYYPIDRVFTLKGFGTVVTGTLFSGQLNKGDELCLYPSEKKLKIRSLERHGRELKQVSSGSRVGINLAGIEKSEVSKGDIIAAENSLLKSKFFEGELKILKSLNFTVKSGDQIHFHSASLDTTGRIYLYDKKEAFPGERVYIKLVLEEKAALFFKQKYIIRRFSPLQTIGGGEILELDPLPKRKKEDSQIVSSLNKLKHADLKDVIEIFIKSSKYSPIKIDFLKKKSALKKENLKKILKNLKSENKIVELIPKKNYIHQKIFIMIKDNILKIMTEYHKNHDLQPGIKKEELRSRLNFKLNKKEMDSLLEILYNKQLLKEKNNLIAKSDFKITLNSDQTKMKDKIINIYKENIFSPPARKEIIEDYKLEKDFFDYLENEGYLLRLSAELYFHPDVFPEVKELLNSYFETNENIDLAEFRDLIDSSRRYALPLLEKLDQLKITKRKGDMRYPAEKLNH